MTPRGLATAECCNRTPEGQCRLLDALANAGDYRVRLPDWLDADTWTSCVSSAREQGKGHVDIHYARGQIDPCHVLRTDEAGRKMNVEGIGRRWGTFYFCAACDAPLGVGGETAWLDCVGERRPPGPLRTECILISSRGQSMELEPMVCHSQRDLDEFLAAAGRKVAHRYPHRRCRYFERAVLPLADQDPPPYDLGLQKDRRAARAKYRQMCPKPAPKDGAKPPKRPRMADRPRDARRCPDCGTPLAKRKKVCPACRRKRREASYRRARGKKQTSPTGPRNR